MPQIHLRGIQLHYEDQGAGTPIVFVHGHPFDHTMWKYQVPRFSSDHRLIMPDLRGYGKTEVVPGKVMMDEMALDILHLLEALQIESAVLCGLSMGRRGTPGPRGAERPHILSIKNQRPDPDRSRGRRLLYTARYCKADERCHSRRQAGPYPRGRSSSEYGDTGCIQ